jgi:hypothetical protein
MMIRLARWMVLVGVAAFAAGCGDDGGGGGEGGEGGADTAEGGEGDATEGGEGDSTEGGEGDSTEGGEGDTTEGGEGDSTEGGEGDSTEGGEGDSTEGGEGDSTEGGDSDTWTGGTVSVTGKLGEFPGGDSIVGAKVCVWEHPEIACVTTDDLGNYELPGIPDNAKVSIHYAAEGYLSLLWMFDASQNTTAWNPLMIPAEAPPAWAPPLGVEPSPAKGSVLARAAYPEGAGFPQASISLEPPSGDGPFYIDGGGPAMGLSETTGDGRAYIFNVDPGATEVAYAIPLGAECQVKWGWAGEYPGSIAATIAENTVTHIEMTCTAPPPPPNGITLTGKVKAALSGKDIEGVEVCVWGNDAVPCVTTGPTGFYTLEEVPKDSEVAIQYKKAGYLDGLWMVATGAQATDWTIELISNDSAGLFADVLGTTLAPDSGMVVFQAVGDTDLGTTGISGALMPDAGEGPVYFLASGLPDAGPISTTADGRGLYVNVPAGDYAVAFAGGPNTVCVPHFGWSTTGIFTLFAAVPANTVTYVAAKCTAEVSISGSVAAQDTGAPLADVEVCVHDTQLQCAGTGPDGSYALDAVPGNAPIAIRYTVDDYVPLLWMFDSSVGGLSWDVELVAKADLAAVATEAGTSQDPSKGVVIFRATDGAGSGLAGVTAKMSPATGEGPIYLDADELADASLTATSTAGLGLILNVDKGKIDTVFTAPGGKTCQTVWSTPGSKPDSAHTVVVVSSATYVEVRCE